MDKYQSEGKEESQGFSIAKGRLKTFVSEIWNALIEFLAEAGILYRQDAVRINFLSSLGEDQLL